MPRCGTWRWPSVAVTERDVAIRGTGLTRRFGHFTAVDRVDVGVRHGEVFGLLGANGAGKTTVIRMLCGTLPPSGGEIRVAGIDMVRRPRLARGRIGYVSQRFALYGELTGLENLRLQAGLYGVLGRRRGRRIEWVVERLNLRDRIRVPSGRLPLGFQRRLALAAALLHEPEVLFLDEPTSGVDPLARQEFWELIYALAEDGMGVLVTTHYMDEAVFCDRLSLMHAGRVVEEGSPEELVKRPLSTPLLALRSERSGAFAGEVSGWESVREVIPHAGEIRIRLEPGSDPQGFMAGAQTWANANAISVDSLKPVQPELEDIFVAVLEEAEREGVQ